MEGGTHPAAASYPRKRKEREEKRGKGEKEVAQWGHGTFLVLQYV